ncbi:hypothetical protein [Paenibacillus sp. OK060]|nr:hypothetical protein [Paenibacillus sp. OK060]
MKIIIIYNEGIIVNHYNASVKDGLQNNDLYKVFVPGETGIGE